MDQVSEQENKGQYCQFVKTADGSYILKPVRVPAHVKAARAERVERVFCGLPMVLKGEGPWNL